MLASGLAPVGEMAIAHAATVCCEAMVRMMAETEVGIDGPKHRTFSF